MELERELTDLPPPRYAAIDTDTSRGELVGDCWAVGYPFPPTHRAATPMAAIPKPATSDACPSLSTGLGAAPRLPVALQPAPGSCIERWALVTQIPVLMCPVASVTGVREGS